MRLTKYFGPSSVAAALALALTGAQVHGQSAPIATAISAEEMAGIRLEPRPVGEFHLQDHEGRTFDHNRLEGNWHMLMFGFTHCPDVCPVHLAMLGQMTGELRQAEYPASGLPQVVLVSVDPRRDSLEHLAEYVAHFDESFIGATGEPEQLKSLEQSLGAGHRIFSEDVEGNYDVMHSSAVYVIDPEGQAVGQIRPPFNPQRLAGAYLQLKQEYGS